MWGTLASSFEGEKPEWNQTLSGVFPREVHGSSAIADFLWCDYTYRYSWSVLSHRVEDESILDKMLTLAKKTFIQVTLRVQMASRNSLHISISFYCTRSVPFPICGVDFFEDWYCAGLYSVHVLKGLTFLWLSVTLVKNRYYHFFILNSKLWIR